MASLDFVSTPVGNLLFYNVDAGVGKGAPNNRADVLLVQYLLKEGSKAPHFAEVQNGAGFTQDQMQITGAWDQYWGGYLANYLHTLQRRGKKVVKDGRVDPVPPGRTRGAIHNAQYTILYLNIGYGVLRPNDLPRLADAPDCPGELRSLLKVQFVH